MKTLETGFFSGIAAGVLILAITPTVDAQGGIDKYTRAPSPQQTETITKDELFDLIKTRYLAESKHEGGRPTLLFHPEKKFIDAVSTVLSNDFEVHCGEARTNSIPDINFLENDGLARQILGAADVIIEMQYDPDPRSIPPSLLTGHRNQLRQQLVGYIERATSYCPQYTVQVKQFLDDFANESERWKQASIERAEQSKMQQSEAIARRGEELRSGRIEIQGISDAALFYRAANGLSVMGNPKVQADNKYYVIQGFLERIEDGGDALLAKFGDNYARIVHVSASKQQVGLLDNLRAGRNFHVVGRYVNNVEYTTVIGASRVVPVFEAAYISQN